ncbi:MAG: phospholipid/cholesterol/gamma-HCH transport system substrate-binding protein [Actinomycetota bacterium]|nr:phospholipid/cholesterol/gamma-HCH transport system substrate-binding protein [Actinomycetota bacterium]
MIRRLLLIVGGLAFIAAVGAGIYYSVSYAYGAFGDYYYVTADLERSGQQLKINADVRVRGVKVGKVSAIELVDRHARLTLEIEDDYQIPQAADAVVSLKTPLGAKYVDLQFDPSTDGPYLADGDAVANARVGPELEDLLDDGVSVLDAINPDDAATLISELASAARGHGVDIDRGFGANAELSDLFAETLDPQIESLTDFNTIFGELKKHGVDFNDLADAINEGAPVYASAKAQRDLDRALKSLVPFADDLSDLLILNRADWDRMFDTQDIVLGTLEDHPGGLRDLVHGLYRYVYKLGQPIDKYFQVGDGSAGAGFTAFSGGNAQAEDEKQICTAFPPEVRDLIPACQASFRQ